MIVRRTLGYEDVLQKLEEKGISIRVASPKLVMEEVSILVYTAVLYGFVPVIIKHIISVLLSPTHSLHTGTGVLQECYRCCQHL